MSDGTDKDVNELRGLLESLRARLDESFGSVEASLKRLRANEKGVERELGKLVVRLARLDPTLDPSVDERFFETAVRLVESRRTMLTYHRLFTLWQAALNTAGLGLPAVEVGSFRGGSAALLAEAYRAGGDGARELHVVDTFEGHLDATLSGHDATERQQGKFTDTSVEDVRAFLAAHPGIEVHQGDASAVVRAWPDRRYGLVHLDVDLYRPILDMLEYFGPRVVAGGVIVVDDYEAPTCPGVAQAVHEFLAGAPGFARWRMQAEQVVLIKRG